MANILKSQRRIFYTIISIAKSTLCSLYYKHSGRITESCVCKIFSSHLAKVRIILPNSLREGFKHIQDIEWNPTIHKSINLFLTQEITTLPESKENPRTSHALNHTKSQETKTLRQNMITGSFSEDLEERKNSPQLQGNYALINKMPALSKTCTSNQAWTWPIQHNTKATTSAPLSPPREFRATWWHWVGQGET